jgi:hypothetical protein
MNVICTRSDLVPHFSHCCFRVGCENLPKRKQYELLAAGSPERERKESMFLVGEIFGRMFLSEYDWLADIASWTSIVFCRTWLCVMHYPALRKKRCQIRQPVVVGWSAQAGRRGFPT